MYSATSAALINNLFKQRSAHRKDIYTYKLHFVCFSSVHHLLKQFHWLLLYIESNSIHLLLYIVPVCSISTLHRISCICVISIGPIGRLFPDNILFLNLISVLVNVRFLVPLPKSGFDCLYRYQII